MTQRTVLRSGVALIWTTRTSRSSTAGGSETPHGPFWILRDRNARLLWTGRTGSWAADQIHEIASIWMTWELTHSSTLTAFVTLSSRLPYWGLGWLAGALADRLPLQKTLVMTSVGSAVIAASLFVLGAFHLLTYAMLVAGSLALGAARTLESPAVMAQIPTLVPPPYVQQMNGIADNSRRVARLVAPLLTNALKNVFPIAWFYALVALAHSVMAVCTAALRTRVIARTSSRASVWTDVWEGWRLVRADRILLLTIACFTLYNPAYATAYWVALPRLAGAELQGGLGGYSAAVAAFGAGGLVGNLCLTFVRVRRHAFVTMLGILLVGLSMAALSLATDLKAVVFIGFIGALGLPMMDISLIVLINERVALHYVGRAYSLWRYFADLGITVGLLIGGPAVDLFGPRSTLLIVSGWVIPLGLLFIMRLRAAEAREALARER